VGYHLGDFLKQYAMLMFRCRM